MLQGPHSIRGLLGSLRGAGAAATHQQPRGDGGRHVVNLLPAWHSADGRGSWDQDQLMPPAIRGGGGGRVDSRP